MSTLSQFSPKNPDASRAVAREYDAELDAMGFFERVRFAAESIVYGHRRATVRAKTRIIRRSLGKGELNRLTELNTERVTGKPRI